MDARFGKPIIRGVAMKVSIVSALGVPEEVLAKMPDNGEGRENAGYLKIETEDSVVYYSDAMESEDARFSRDLGWIESALQIAYNAGRKGA
jgi:hypothetical protein